MEYAQLHTDILADPKLMRAARKGLKGLELTPWFIAFAKAAKDNGRLTVGGEPVEPADLVGQIPGQTSRSIAVALKSLESIDVLARDDDGALFFVAWDNRQAKPSSSPEAVRERVRKHRELRRRNAGGTPEGSNGAHVTDVTPGNATEESRSNLTEPNPTEITHAAGSDERRSEPREPQAPMDRLRAGIPAIYHPDLDNLLTRVKDPQAWAGELTMVVEGGTAGTGVSYTDLGLALRDFRLNGKAEVPQIALLRAYVKRAAGDRHRPQARSRNGTTQATTTTRIRSVL